MRLSKLLLAASAAVLFAACQPATDTNHPDTAGAKLATTTVPHAQLPDTVTPKSYQIDLKIDPQQDGMSGTVAIDVKINEAADRLWIHAKEMTVSSARIDYTDGTSIDLDFHAVSATEAPSGIAYLTADGTISAGEGVITLDYETPYNQNLQVLTNLSSKSLSHFQSRHRWMKLSFPIRQRRELLMLKLTESLG